MQKTDTDQTKFKRRTDFRAARSTLSKVIKASKKILNTEIAFARVLTPTLEAMSTGALSPS